MYLQKWMTDWFPGIFTNFGGWAWMNIKQTKPHLLIISIRLFENSKPCIHTLKNDLGRIINASILILSQGELCKMNKFI